MIHSVSVLDEVAYSKNPECSTGVVITLLTSVLVTSPYNKPTPLACLVDEITAPSDGSTNAQG